MWNRSAQSAQPGELEEASLAISRMFAPTHSTLPPCKDEVIGRRRSGLDTSDTNHKSSRPGDAVGAATLVTRSHQAVAVDREGELIEGHWWQRLRDSWSWARSSRGDCSELPLTIPAKPTERVPVNWKDLPSCPIAGFSLNKDGLTDTLTAPPHVLTTCEVRALIGELAGIEQKAKYTVDEQYFSQMNSRTRRGIELIVNPTLFLVGIYLMTWKSAQLYRCATPRKSIVLGKLSDMMSAHLQSERAEALARQHRRFMQATNLRVTSTFLTGLFVFTVALITKPPPDVVDAGPEVEVAKSSVAFQQHSEGSLKWLWYVYYHHPRYATEASSSLRGGLPGVVPNERKEGTQTKK